MKQLILLKFSTGGDNTFEEIEKYKTLFEKLVESVKENYDLRIIQMCDSMVAGASVEVLYPRFQVLDKEQILALQTDMDKMLSEIKIEIAKQENKNQLKIIF